MVDARARASQRGRQHWTAAFPQLEAWIMSRPALSTPMSGPASEISSLVSGDDFSDRLLVSTSSLLAQQDLVVQTQNGVNMASGTATTAPNTATTAPSMAPLPLTAGPSTIEPIVPIVAPLGAQGTPSVIQGARPVISTEQTMQSTAVYGTLPYVSGLPYTAPLPYAAYTAPLPYAARPAMSARPSFPMGNYGQGNQFPLMPNPNWMSERKQMLQHQLLQERQQFEAWRASQAQPQPQPLISSSGPPIKVGDDVEIISGRSASAKRARPEDQATDKAKHARSASTSRRSPSPKSDYPRGTCTATRPSQASPKRAEHTPAPAQDLEAFKAGMTSMLSDMLQSSLSTFASQFNPSFGGQGDSAPTQTVASVPTMDVASDHEDIPLGPEDQSEGEIVDSEGDSADAGIPRLDSLKMTEEEERDYDGFSLASVSVPKRPWRAQEDSNVSKPQPQNISLSRQARPVTSQAVAKAQSVKSAQSDQRSVQLRSSVQDQPMSQAQFPVLVSQGQGQRQGLGRPVVVRRDDLDSLHNEEEFSIDVDNEAVLGKKTGSFRSSGQSCGIR